MTKTAWVTGEQRDGDHRSHATVTRLVGLGFKDHSAAGRENLHVRSRGDATIGATAAGKAVPRGFSAFEGVDSKTGR
jgi:hypothetical protein